LNTVTPYNRATRWKPHHSFLHGSIPVNLVCRLLDRASLTWHLQQLCAGKIRVEVLSQVRDTPRLDEAQMLGMRPREMAIVRQVLLLCGGTPWVYARTVIPVASLRGKLQRLAGLGTRPLGAVLFADPGMRRGSMELAEILPGHAIYTAATAYLRYRPAVLWGRRSVFTLFGKPLLVSEVFLPDFPADRAVVSCWRSQ